MDQKFNYKRSWILPSNRRSRNLYMAIVACLVAISVILTRYFSILLFANALRISIGDLPVTIAGFLLGPVFGGITGVLADIIGQIIRPMGAPHYGIMLTKCLYGVIPGLYMMFYQKFNRRLIIITDLTVIILLSALMQTQWITDFTHLSYGVQLIQRLPGILFNGGALLATSLLLYPALTKITKQVQNQL